MSKSNQKPVSLALCTALVGGLALSGSAFAMQPMTQGYLLSATATAGDQDQAAEKKAESSDADTKAAEGKCGEGKCGMDKIDSDKDGKASRAEFDAAHPDKPAKFDTIDTNKDGFVDAAESKAHHEGKCGEGKCGADKKADAKADHAEGKCGEGKCGGSI